MCWNIEQPRDKTYPLVFDIPFDINIISVASQLGTGTIGTLTLPATGLLSAGADISVDVDDPSLDAEDLLIKIYYERV
jgi:hypothetical protein